MPIFESSFVVIALWAIIGYVLGSIPFGLVVSRIMGLGDVRNIGSGNIGATNVLRTGNKSAALLTLLMDGGKGALAVLLAYRFAGWDAAQIAGLTAFIGHLYPVWLKFKGGKGVATFLGIVLALAWPVGIATCATWLLTAIVARISSLAALVAATASPIWMAIFGKSNFVLVVAVMTVLIFIKHIPNIKRLAHGSEPKIGQKS